GDPAAAGGQLVRRLQGRAPGRPVPHQPDLHSGQRHVAERARVQRAASALRQPQRVVPDQHPARRVLRRRRDRARLRAARARRQGAFPLVLRHLGSRPEVLRLGRQDLGRQGDSVQRQWHAARLRQDRSHGLLRGSRDGRRQHRSVRRSPMATFTEIYNKDGAFYHPTGGGPLAGRTTSREYDDGDVVKLHQIERDTKIGNATLSASAMDVHATPTMTAVLELTDGTTTVALVSMSAATIGAGGVEQLTNPAALGYVVPSRGFWLQIRITAAPATVAAGIFGFSVY